MPCDVSAEARTAVAEKPGDDVPAPEVVRQSLVKRWQRVDLPAGPLKRIPA